VLRRTGGPGTFRARCEAGFAKFGSRGGSREPARRGNAPTQSWLGEGAIPERSAQRIYAVGNKILAAQQAGEPEVAA
jgi:hypothetical protein